MRHTLHGRSSPMTQTDMGIAEVFARAAEDYLWATYGDCPSHDVICRRVEDHRQDIEEWQQTQGTRNAWWNWFSTP